MDSNDSLLQQLVDSTFSEEATRTEIKTALQNLQIDSVFDIASLSAERFANTLTLQNAGDAQQIYEEAVACAHMISRLYYEQQLSPELAKQRNRRDADQVSAPVTYQSLFDEDWQQFCHEGHIAANNSPIAYLRALYRYALDLENSSTHADRITLEERRSDLAGLILDAQNTFVERPMVSVINETLNTHIQNHLDKINNDKTVQEVLASEHYPLELPYDLHHQQCQLALGENRPALGELNYRINLNLPFSGIDSTYGGSSKTRIESQKLLSGLSPAQQKLLTAPSDDQVVWNAYGSKNNALLWRVDCFQKLTGLTDDQIEELLAYGKYFPNTSINNLWSERHRYGRLYINRNAVGAVVAIGEHFVNFSTARLDCMIRMTRLQRWTGISFAELDTMIMNIGLAAPDNYSGMNDNTLRALGVHRHLSKRYSIKPEEFASFYYNMPTYACGDRSSLFDQVFSNTPSTTNPLIENNGKDIDIEASVATLKFLQAGLDASVTQGDFLLIVRQCKRHLPAFKHDLSSASALYRYARIAKMFGLSPAECTDLARLLGGEAFCKTLVTGVIREGSNNVSDIFDVLMAMDWAVDWLKRNQYSVKQWCRLLDKTRDDVALNTELENLVKALKAKPHDTDDKKNLLIQTLLHDVASLSLDEIACAMKLAGTSEVAIFDEITAQTLLSGKRLPLLASALRAGEAVQALVLTNDALLKLLNNPEWLAYGNSGALTPHTLYLLDRFSTCTRHHVQAETRFLKYLEQTNSPLDAMALLNFNITLTELLDWTIEEVSALTADLPHHCARSIEEVDWVIRCKNGCNETGLSMNNLKLAASLNTEKPAADWKIVGEALVAAHS